MVFLLICSLSITQPYLTCVFQQEWYYTLPIFVSTLRMKLCICTHMVYGVTLSTCWYCLVNSVHDCGNVIGFYVHTLGASHQCGLNMKCTYSGKKCVCVDETVHSHVRTYGCTVSHCLIYVRTYVLPIGT